MATIYIDNKPYEVKDGQNLLNACLSLGFDIPYFCWHPAMHSVGACRQCAVKEYKDEKDTKGKVVMSCMTPAKDGTRISIDDPEVRAFRKNVIEWMMTNHPHDCPVCDEGSECHLQDMTVMTGHDYRRFRFKKRTFRNQYLGPFITHEMNRCIQCYRCVRFYRDYAGGRDFDVFAIHNAVFFGRHSEGVLESEFTGNLAEICPTGVFTDKSLKRHYTRKWDLQTAPSVCVHCGVGCNTIPGERYGKLRRIRARYHGDVNRYFLCDRGRYGYEFVNSGKRLRRPVLGRNTGGASKGTTEGMSLTSGEAIGHISEMLKKSAGVIGIGSPRASLESNFALRSLVGPANFYSGMSDSDHRLTRLIADILKKGPARPAALSDVESSDAVLVLGEDVLNTAPILALSLRQTVRRKQFEIAGKLHVPLWDDAAVREAAQNEKSPVFLATPYKTKLEDLAAGTFYGPPDEIARLGFAIAHELNGSLSAPENLSDRMKTLAVSISEALRAAKRPLVVSGTGCCSESVIRAAADVTGALAEINPDAAVAFAVPECNSLGAALMGGGSLKDGFDTVGSGQADTVIVLENDLYRRAEGNSVEQFLRKVRNLIVLDHIKTPTVAAAAAALPAASFAETDGTLVNNEGRAQRFFQVFVPEADIRESWRWLGEIMTSSGRGDGMEKVSLDAVLAAMAREMPEFAKVPDAAPPAGFRIERMRIPRQPHRYSGRTAMFADTTVFDPRPPRDNDSPLSFSMEGFQGEPPSPLLSRFWAPGWNSPQAINKFQIEVGGPLRAGNPGVRLIEQGLEKADFRTASPDVFVSRKGEFLILRIHHIFGSEELSIHSPGIAELSPKPYLALRPDDAAEAHLQEGSPVSLNMNGNTHNLNVRIMPSLSEGTAGLPSGVPGLDGVELPAWGKIA